MDLTLNPKERVLGGSAEYDSRSGGYQINPAWDGRAPLPVQSSLTDDGTRHAVRLHQVEINAYDPSVHGPKHCRVVIVS